MDNFQWGGCPYDIEVKPAVPGLHESPEDYLLAYWIGRYYGYIGPED